MNMKADFTEIERNIIQAICSMYNIQTIFDKYGIFKGLIPKGTRITLNGTYFEKLINTSNAIYLEDKFDGMMELIIVAQ